MEGQCKERDIGERGCLRGKYVWEEGVGSVQQKQERRGGRVNFPEGEKIKASSVGDSCEPNCSWPIRRET